MTWDTDQYWKKACLYIARADSPTRGAWEKPFWHALALEFLARGSLCAVHPVLNADPVKDEGANILFALGYPHKKQPRSIPAHSVTARLITVVSDFGPPQRAFCDYFFNLRNQELHTSDSAFASIKESSWLARYYEVALILCSHLNRPPSDLLGDDRAAHADVLVKTLKANIKSSVLSRIAAHKKVFAEKPDNEKKRLSAAAHTANRWPAEKTTHTECPACQCRAIITGIRIGISEPYYEEGELVADNEFLSSELKCLACGLHLKDLNELVATDIQPTFKTYSTTDLHDLAQHEYEGPDYDNM